jgi:hypothetical protein
VLNELFHRDTPVRSTLQSVVGLGAVDTRKGPAFWGQILTLHTACKVAALHADLAFAHWANPKSAAFLSKPSFLPPHRFSMQDNLTDIASKSKSERINISLVCSGRCHGAPSRDSLLDHPCCLGGIADVAGSYKHIAHVKHCPDTTWMCFTPNCSVQKTGSAVNEMDH